MATGRDVLASATSAPSIPVNIVMRTRNRPRLLARALDDVLGQSSPQWVLTIVNDGGAPEPVDGLVAERSDAFANRVLVLHNPSSRGMEAASNQGILARESRYVAVHDDDDTWDPTFLETTVRWLDDVANGSAPAVAVRTEIVWEEVLGASVRELSREVFLPERTQITLTDLIRFNACVPISMLYRRANLIDAGLFDESLPVAGDWECNLRLASTGQLGFLPDKVLAYWHQRPGAVGDLGNSVVALRDDHRAQDALVRDRALRRSVAEDGLGLPLYLTRFLDDRFDEMRERLDSLEGLARDRPFERMKRLVRAARPPWRAK